MRRLATLATAMAIPVLGLSACGGSSKSTSGSSNSTTTGGSDRDQVTAIIKQFNNDPPSLCNMLATPALIKANFGSKAACLKAAASPGAKDPFVKIDSLTFKRLNTKTFKGPSATVVTTAGVDPGKGTREQTLLIKQSGTWKVADIEPLSH